MRVLTNYKNRRIVADGTRLIMQTHLRGTWWTDIEIGMMAVVEAYREYLEESGILDTVHGTYPEGAVPRRDKRPSKGTGRPGC